MRSWVDHGAAANASVVTHGHVPVQKCAVTDHNIAGRHDSSAENDSLSQRNFLAVNNRRRMNKGENAEPLRADPAEHLQSHRGKPRAKDDHWGIGPAPLLGQPSVVTGHKNSRGVGFVLPGLNYKPLKLDAGGCLAKQLPHLSRQTARTKHDRHCTSRHGHRPSVTVRTGSIAWHNPNMPSDQVPLTSLMMRPGDSLLDALRVLEGGRVRGAIVTDGADRLIGIVTDGDIRRALLAGETLQSPIDAVIERAPLTVTRSTSRADVIDLMRSRDVSFVPVVDGDGKVSGLHLLNEMIGREVLPNAALVMAGGRGSRLGELTKSLPKPLLKVAGRPVIEWILLHLVSEGIRKVYVSTGYLAEEIENHLGNGADFGCEIKYLRDPEGRPLGSGGPLGLLSAEGLTTPFIAMNGDLMTRFGLREMLSAHQRLGNDVTIAALTYTVDIPFGVLETGKGGRVTAMSEKPSASWPVNAGIYVINPKELPPGRPEMELPMTTFIQDRLDRGAQVGTWEIDGDWIDIGRPEDLDAARGNR